MNSRRALAFIFCTVTLDVLALGMMIPVLPTLVLGFMGGDTAGAAEMFGVFATAWALMQFLCSPLLGALSDRFGRRPVILISCLGLGLDYIFMALAPRSPCCSSAGSSPASPRPRSRTAFAYIADVTPPDERAASFRHASAWRSAWASCSGRRSAACSAASTRACRSGSRRRPA